MGDHAPDVALEITGWLGRLHLVQPYNWRSWTAEFPSISEIESLTVDECVLHVTRLARLDRVQGGLLMSCASSGLLRALCERIAHLVERGRVPVVPKPSVVI